MKSGQSKVQKATKDLPQKEGALLKVAEYFNVLSEPSRLRIMYVV